MKFLFIVQGEGRGHMTQAVALSQILEGMGHEVAATCIGKSKRRNIPEFVIKNLKSPVHSIESPNFVSDKNNRKILLGKSILLNLSKFPVFLKSLRNIDEVVKHHNPDVIINFYDILGGLYNLLYRPQASCWAIGHQYLIDHPDFPFAKSHGLEKLLFKINTKITSMGTDRIFALSFRPLASNTFSKVRIVPPILRKDIFELNPSEGDFILSYMVNPGYGEEVVKFAKRHPNIKIEAFWDKKGVGKTHHALPNLTFHQVDDQLFLSKMASCKGLLSTAGFESICEAMYLGKPVMMVPVAGQYEQACNALDAIKSGAGISNKNFDFKFFHDYLSASLFQPSQMDTWAKMTIGIMEEEIGMLQNVKKRNVNYGNQLGHEYQTFHFNLPKKS
ncbi:glycosyltransferase family protein [Belliella marina]|uniref:Glycosyltransferase family protein n=1 Tax=Belliella marina TaxID=1644146 RepID=A0ABW4VHI6_9BACT